jgi:hypothetical protein
MTISHAPDGDAPPPNTHESTGAAALAVVPLRVKVARILDEDDGSFGLEYDDTRGQKNLMRLDALTYEGAIREARSFLEIRPDDCDVDGSLWTVE